MRFPEPQVWKGRKGWYANFRFNGKRFRFRLKATSKVAARQELREFFASLTIAEDEAGRGNYTMNDAAVLYWEGKAQFIAAGPGVVYPALLQFRDFVGSDTMLASIKPADIGRYVARKRQTLANDTVNTHLKWVRAMLNWCRDDLEALVPKIKWKDYFLPEKETDNSLPPETVESIADHAAAHLRPIILAALYTGLRKGNILRMRWEQVDLPNRIITIRVKSKKPEGKILHVPIIDPMYVLLLNQGPQDHGWIFMWQGKVMASIKTSFATAKKNAGITGAFRFHDIRHSTATAMMRASGDIHAVKKALGHANIETTERYLHADVSDQRTILEHTFSGSHDAPSKAATKAATPKEGPANNVS